MNQQAACIIFSACYPGANDVELSDGIASNFPIDGAGHQHAMGITGAKKAVSNCHARYQIAGRRIELTQTHRPRRVEKRPEEEDVAIVYARLLSTPPSDHLFENRCACTVALRPWKRQATSLGTSVPPTMPEDAPIIAVQHPAFVPSARPPSNQHRQIDRNPAHHQNLQRYHPLLLQKQLPSRMSDNYVTSPSCSAKPYKPPSQLHL